MRKTKEIKITAEGRDKGKLFIVHEMDAWRGEEWAWRAMVAMGANMAIPPTLRGTAWAGIAAMGLRGVMGTPFHLLKPLLDEMFDICLSYVPEPSSPSIYRGAKMENALPPAGPLQPNDTEEVETRLLLRNEIFMLHSGFSMAASLYQIWEQVMAAISVLTPSAQTSPEASLSSSPPAGQA